MPGPMFLAVLEPEKTPLLPESASLLRMGVRIGFTLLGALVVQQLLFLAVSRVAAWIRRAGEDRPHARQRAVTVAHLLRNLVNVLLGGAVLLHALEILGWDVKPLLAGAGVVGVALGFGAQTLVRDVIAGIFIIAEDQFGVGDAIEVNGRVATVEQLTVRQTTLRDFNGFLMFVPNGEMKLVVNRSRLWNRVAVDVPIGVGEDVDRALELCERVAAAMSEEPAWKPRLLGPIEVPGVERLGTHEAQIRLLVRGRPGSDTYEAARELRRRLLTALAGAGVRTTLPFTQVPRAEPTEPHPIA